MARDLARRARQSVEQQQASATDLREQLAKMESHFQRAMPRGGEAVQLIRDVMTCMSQTPKLAQCEPRSVLGAAMTCAQLGLRPGVGALGQAWILPFWDARAGANKAQLIIGYKGYVELGHRSDRIASLHSRIVYSNDVFDVEYGAAEDTWIHKPCLDGPRGEARLFYAVGRLANGGYSITDPMTVDDMKAHRDRFAMARKNGKVIGPWVDHFDAMAQKTMLLRLMTLMPKSTEIQRAMDNDGSVRLDLAEEAIDAPMHIDGEVIEGDAEEDAAEGAVAPPPAPPAAPAAADGDGVQMASKDQLDRLAQIQKAEKYNDADWFAFLAEAAGVQATRANDLTFDEAARAIAIFDGPDQ
ncbi:RecT-like ssDNA annealing protein [Mycobacterium phage ThulaThula]|uniref:RecT-like DNA pairing protein n=1 Tax=Mycobacterium phage ThulaThula TaxID=2599880 RepID=A0A5J6TE16_9CAUD|nr:RecT-like ssDNA annealing protein [Mycobacterium phage ThulaThula]QFG09081.1 RecT-like DNA pairing protein [Mycobacterium phage ThulaThula]